MVVTSIMFMFPYYLRIPIQHVVLAYLPCIKCKHEFVQHVNFTTILLSVLCLISMFSISIYLLFYAACQAYTQSCQPYFIILLCHDIITCLVIHFEAWFPFLRILSMHVSMQSMHVSVQSMHVMNEPQHTVFSMQ